MLTKELREKRGVIAQSMKEFNDKIEAEGRDFTPEEDAKFAEMHADCGKLTAKIERAEQLEEADSYQRSQNDRPDTGPEGDGKPAQGPTEEQRCLALQAWAVGGKRDLTDEHREACRVTGIRPGRDLEINLPNTRQARAIQRDHRQASPHAEYRALSAVVGVSGGFTVPEGFVADWERALLDFSGVRQVAEIIRTDSGNDLPWPTTDDTSNEGELLGENNSVKEKDITVGQIIWKAYKYSSKMVKVPVELLEDSAFDVASMLGSMLGERIGRITNRHTTTGDGAAKPNGIVTAAAAGPTTAGANAILADELFNLIHSVDPAYRGTGAGLMMHDNVLLAIRKLKDGNGQYLFQPGLTVGVPNTILSFPFTINQNMTDTISTGLRTILFGQLSKYKIREVRGMRMKRLVERFATEDQEAFLAFVRIDGGLLDAGTNPVKALIQA